MADAASQQNRKRTIRNVRRLEGELYRILENEQTVHGYGIEDYLSLIHPLISAIYNRGGTREAIADALQVTSESVYGMPLPRQSALAIADRINRQVRFAQR
jgi:hypothetical protein